MIDLREYSDNELVNVVYNDASLHQDRFNLDIYDLFHVTNDQEHRFYDSIQEDKEAIIKDVKYIEELTISRYKSVNSDEIRDIIDYNLDDQLALHDETVKEILESYGLENYYSLLFEDSIDAPVKISINHMFKQPKADYLCSLGIGEVGRCIYDIEKRHEIDSSILEDIVNKEINGIVSNSYLYIDMSDTVITVELDLKEALSIIGNSI